MPPFAKGQSGNPHGRPPKQSALSVILADHADHLTATNGRTLAHKELLSLHLWHLVTEGTVTFPDGHIITADATEWMRAVSWLIDHMDAATARTAAPVEVLIIHHSAEPPTFPDHPTEPEPADHDPADHDHPPQPL